MSFCFCKTKRLLSSNDYKVVFDHPTKKIHTEHFLLFVYKSDKHFARLGLAITKKKIKHAVDRNYIKRCTREAFRLAQHDLPFVDCVLVVKRHPHQDSLIFREINTLFARLSDLQLDG